MGLLTGKVVIVTGGCRGIGLGIAEILVGEGAQLALLDIDTGNAGEVVVALSGSGLGPTIHQCDVTDPESITRAVGEALAAHNKIDVLVNNAGVSGTGISLDTLTEADWDACLQVNLKGAWNMVQACLPAFRQAGGGRIINISSIAGLQATPDLAAYAASKAGVNSLTRSLAKGLGRENITVNAVCPGFLWTDMWAGLSHSINERLARGDKTDRERFEQVVKMNCALGREQTPADIGAAVAFLASDGAANITGQCLAVDGGATL